MNATIRVFKKTKNTRIEIIPRPSNIELVGAVFFYISPFLIITVMWIYLIPYFGGGWGFIFPIALIALLRYFVLINLRKLFEQEIVLLNENSLTIYKQYIWIRDKRDFDRATILDLKYAGAEKFTENSDFDYLGKGIANKDIEWLSTDGNISFFYKGSVIRFGKDIYAEDAQIVINTLDI